VARIPERVKYFLFITTSRLYFRLQYSHTQFASEADFTEVMWPKREADNSSKSMLPPSRIQRRVDSGRLRLALSIGPYCVGST
jgi:hypothetical protein